MFSFHKPRIYRSVSGCCICKAKSSSSRFTDSKKYEAEFALCFRILERRTGEICNACVLLVKRWKKLPDGTNRDWHHVVDARAGPGTKSFMKYKSKSSLSKRLPKKIRRKRTDTTQYRRKPHRHSPGGEMSDDIAGEECLSDLSGNSSSLAPSPTISEEDIFSDEELVRMEGGASSSYAQKKRKAGDEDMGRRKRTGAGEKRRPCKISSFLDMTFWKKEKVCCGTIFKGPDGEVLIDPRLMRRCISCKDEPPFLDAAGQSQITSASTSPVSNKASSPESRLETVEAEDGESTTIDGTYLNGPLSPLAEEGSDLKPVDLISGFNGNNYVPPEQRSY